MHAIVGRKEHRTMECDETSGIGTVPDRRHRIYLVDVCQKACSSAGAVGDPQLFAGIDHRASRHRRVCPRGEEVVGRQSANTIRKVDLERRRIARARWRH